MHVTKILRAEALKESRRQRITGKDWWNARNTHTSEKIKIYQYLERGMLTSN